jgi:putative ABC transport system ATP-binding protein
VTAAPKPLVRLEGVARTYPGPPPVEALRMVDLEIDQGEYVSIVGPSGSGKSTLLNVLGCLDRPTAGRYLLDDIDVSTLPDGDRAALRGARIGFVFQAFHLLPHRSAVENVAMALLYQRTRRRERLERARRALERVGLGHRLSHLPSQLSGGERQRVAIARAIAGEPRVLLSDEPTGNLDTRSTTAILDLFDQLRADGLTIVVITHDEAVSDVAPRRIRVVDGRITEDLRCVA